MSEMNKRGAMLKEVARIASEIDEAAETYLEDPTDQNEASLLTKFGMLRVELEAIFGTGVVVSGAGDYGEA